MYCEPLCDRARVLFEGLICKLNQDHTVTITVCSGSVVVIAYDFESGCTGSNPEWGLIYY